MCASPVLLPRLIVLLLLVACSATPLRQPKAEYMRLPSGGPAVCWLGTSDGPTAPITDALAPCPGFETALQPICSHLLADGGSQRDVKTRQGVDQKHQASVLGSARTLLVAGEEGVADAIADLAKRT